ncbi:MAG: hypothetical protein ACLFWL_07445 [Candidatus Brocadiia bacterium]
MKTVCEDRSNGSMVSDTITGYQKIWIDSGQILLIIFVCAFLATAAQGKDVTEKVETVGKPFKKPAYGRNVWDMRLFNKRIYFGHGNSSNKGPAQNVGPIPIVVYDLEDESFRKVFTVSEEQIDIFRLIDGTLYVPGHDPKDSWKLGNFYRLERDGWKKYRTIPGGIHCYDMYKKHNVLFAALGSKKNAVYMSGDNGATWKTCPHAGSGRRYVFFEVNNTLFTMAQVIKVKGRKRLGSGVTGFNPRTGRWKVRKKINFDKLFPNAPDYIFPSDKNVVSARVARPVLFRNKTLYLGVKAVNDHQWDPFGFYIATVRGGKGYTVHWPPGESDQTMGHFGQARRRLRPLQ